MLKEVFYKIYSPITFIQLKSQGCECRQVDRIVISWIIELFRAVRVHQMEIFYQFVCYFKNGMFVTEIDIWKWHLSGFQQESIPRPYFMGSTLILFCLWIWLSYRISLLFFFTKLCQLCRQLIVVKVLGTFFRTWSIAINVLLVNLLVKYMC